MSCRIAFLASANMVRPGPDMRDDAYEHDLEFGMFQGAAAERDMDLVCEVWDDANIDWAQYDAVMVGTAWDYVQKREKFFSVMAEIAGQTRLFNDLAILRANGDKRYLLELGEKGVPVIPTQLVEEVTPENMKDAFAAFGSDTLVCKPVVGAGAWRQAVIRRGENLPDADELPPGAAFLQPFLPGIQSEGEISLMFYDSEFSHAVRKQPKAGDYRIQSIYGGVETAEKPNADHLRVAKAALSALPAMPLYARADLVPGLDGAPTLIELEMIEPYHYVEQGPQAGEMLMHVLHKRLA